MTCAIPRLARRSSPMRSPRGSASAGFECDVDNKRGLDHGAWVPLSLIYPGADIPVVELSVQPRLGPEHHLRIGRALAPLRDEGVLIIGSGSFTHDLSEFRGRELNEASPAWVNQFADWFDAALTQGRTDDLVHYARSRPLRPKEPPDRRALAPPLRRARSRRECHAASTDSCQLDLQRPPYGCLCVRRRSSGRRKVAASGEHVGG